MAGEVEAGARVKAEEAEAAALHVAGLLPRGAT